MTQLETYFQDDGIASGFKTIFDKMMVSGLEELLKNTFTNQIVKVTGFKAGEVSLPEKNFQNLHKKLDNLPYNQGYNS